MQSLYEELALRLDITENLSRQEFNKLTETGCNDPIIGLGYFGLIWCVFHFGIINLDG